MNGGHQVSIEEIVKAVRANEVFALFFPILRKTLLLDLRSNQTTPPFVRLLPMARSPEERIQYLRRMRPNLPHLENLTLIPWTRYAESMVPTGVYDELLRRVSSTGDANAVRAVQEALKSLRQLEWDEVVAAVRGESSYQTIWGRKVV